MNRQNVKLGIAPIAWTNDDLPELGGENTFEQCVSEMALAGFTGSEIGNKYPKDTGVLKKALDLRGIRICNAWFSSFLISKPYGDTKKRFDSQAAFLAEMGAKVIGVSEQSYSIQGIGCQPIFEGRYVMNDKEWETLCDGLNRLGKWSVENYGIALTFHHHMGTVVQSAAETKRLMEHTDPAYVSLLFDSGHFAYCGENPAAVLKEHVGRVKHVHLKDIRAEVIKKVRENRLSFLDGVKAGTFTIPGDGCVDFEPIFRLLSEADYRGYMVVEAEQDPARANPLEYAMRARRYIAEKTGL